MGNCQMLGERTEIGIEAAIARRIGLPRDGLQAESVVRPQPELIEELPHRVLELLAAANPLRDAGQRRAQPLRCRRVLRKPI